MTRNDRHALIILCLILLISVIGLVSRNVIIQVQSSTANQAKVEAYEDIINLEEETTSEPGDEDNTIEATTTEEATDASVEETTVASVQTVTGNNNTSSVTSTTQEETTASITADTTSSYTALTEYNQSLLDAINAARSAAGLDSVYLDSRLTADAVIRVNEEAIELEIDHLRLDNSECFSVDKGYYTAEILYRGNSTDATKIVDAWLNSTKHHDIILDVNYTHTACGIAVVKGSDGLYYCCIGFR